MLVALRGSIQVATMMPAISGTPNPSPSPIPIFILLDDPAEVDCDDVAEEDVLVAVALVAPPTPAAIVVLVAVAALLGKFVNSKVEALLELGMADEAEVELGVELAIVELDIVELAITELVEDVGESLIFWLSLQQFSLLETQHQVLSTHWIMAALNPSTDMQADTQFGEVQVESVHASLV